MPKQLVERLRQLLDDPQPDVRPEHRASAERLRGGLWKRLRAELHDVPLARRSTAGLGLDLLERLRSGDASAFDALFEQHGAALLAYAAKSLAAHDAEDAVQEAWLDFVRKRESIPERVEIVRWLFGFVRTAVSRVQRAALREAPLSDDPPDADGDRAALELLAREENERLAKALASVSTIEQDVVLAFLDGSEASEVAAQLGLQTGHVRVLKHRALQKLKLALGGEA